MISLPIAVGPHLRHALLLRRRINRLARGRDYEPSHQHGDLIIQTGGEQALPNDSSFGDSATRSIAINASIASDRINRLLTRNNGQLPNSVLEARARLLERLRGISVTQNRQVGEASSSSLISDDGEIEAGWNLLESGRHSFSSLHETGSSVDGRSGNTSMIRTRRSSDHSNISWDGLANLDDFVNSIREQLLQYGSNNRPGISPDYRRSPGLNWETIQNLPHEVFKDDEHGDVKLQCDCCICLENFWDGDGLLRLQCGHRFHSACLQPWLRTCGDCPYCRNKIQPVPVHAHEC
ncbi:hypothetical protein HPP92_026344 [Vanilla planifolia]|uniref:RING-type domain-containing protein n=1 Tax=Vanilla planifolia TaxID=51239 RepID=A0A835PGV1_VANPL|nr:hypothetical protein HPP92_026344 [Vanilla planifolia]